MSKKAKYSLLIVIIIILAALAYLFVFNKMSQNELVKTENVDVAPTREQIIEKLNQEDIAQRIQADAARRAQEATSSTITASSTGNINIK